MEHRILKISFNNGIFYCRVLGNGHKKVIAFHGFGQNGDIYSSLAAHFSDYTIYSFDLPFHGNTEVTNQSTCFSSSDVIVSIERLLLDENIKSFSLIAFSIGAKLCYPLIGKLHTNIDRVWLLAPDGINPNIWYRIATGTQIARSIFHHIMDKPSTFFAIGEMLKSIKLVNTKLWAWVRINMDSQSKRNQVYNTWINLRCLKTNEQEIAKALSSVTDVGLVLGETDKIIRKTAIEKAQRKITQSSLHILPCGHHNLIKYFSVWMIQQKKEL